MESILESIDKVNLAEESQKTVQGEDLTSIKQTRVTEEVVIPAGENAASPIKTKVDAPPMPQAVPESEILPVAQEFVITQVHLPVAALSHEVKILF